MREISFDFNDAVFTYAVSTQTIEKFQQHRIVSNGRLVVNYTAGTDVITQKAESREVTIIGYCVDAHGEIARPDIPRAFLSRKFDDMTSAYRYFDRFAGKYAVLYQDGDELAMWGDATCSLPINYSVTGESFCASCTDKLTADCLNARVSDVSLKIRKGSSAYSQPLPNDLTMYDEVKALLPNHYLNCVTGKAIRVLLDVHETSSMDEISSIVARTSSLARAIASAYQKDFDLVLPLTAGTDSRTMLSFFRSGNPNIPCFTFKHKSFTEETADLAVPRYICEKFHLSHQIIPDLTAPEICRQNISEGAGAFFDKGSVNMAYTFRSNLDGKTQIDGEIIDEIGKSTQENSVPNLFLNVPYFMCKLHNYEPSAKKELKKYIDEIHAAGDWEHIADLFAMEQKCGRRVGQLSALYSLGGIRLLNIFNCRELILQWTRIPRELRIRKFLPREFIRQNDAELLEVPFNPDDKLVSFLKKNWVSFYLATYAKYYLAKFHLRR